MSLDLAIHLGNPCLFPLTHALSWYYLRLSRSLCDRSPGSNSICDFGHLSRKAAVECHPKSQIRPQNCDFGYISSWAPRRHRAQKGAHRLAPRSRPQSACGAIAQKKRAPSGARLEIYSSTARCRRARRAPKRPRLPSRPRPQRPPRRQAPPCARATRCTSAHRHRWTARERRERRRNRSRPWAPRCRTQIRTWFKPP